MKTRLFSLLASAAIIISGCSSDEDIFSSFVPETKMKTVTLTAGMPSEDDTRAAISSEDGKFTWQAGDKISVLATDNRFYNLTLSAGANTNDATFTGAIPENENLTTVAIHPALNIENEELGLANTIYNSSDGVLDYPLQSEYNYVKDCSNVPMVATVVQSATDEFNASFKQIGAVIRYTVNRLPKTAKIVFTANNLRVTGSYEVKPAEAGTTTLNAVETEGVNGTITVNYSAKYDGESAVINIPVPTGSYKDFSLAVYDEEDNLMQTKTNHYDEPGKQIKRATLLMMKPFAAGPMMVTEVWPYFVDARVRFVGEEDASSYAIYIDGSESPAIVSAEVNEDDGFSQILFGGEFSHLSTHTIAIAKVVNGEIDASSKSKPVSFTTGEVQQRTNNVGTTFVCAEWTDVANGGKKHSYGRTFEVQLFDTPDVTSTPVYTLYTINEVSDDASYRTDVYTGSSWLGKADSDNVPTETALSMGFLKPGTDYYFRVRNVEGKIVKNESNGWYLAPEATFYSVRGGCAWSNLVQMSTEPEHVAGEYEIFYEDFDEVTLTADFINMAAGVTPSFLNASSASTAAAFGAEYPSFLNKSLSESKFCAVAFNMSLHLNQCKILNKNGCTANTPATFQNAGTLNGWQYQGASSSYCDAGYGYIRVGSHTKTSKAYVTTPALNSDKLKTDEDTKCKVKMLVSYVTTDYDPVRNEVTLSRSTTNEMGVTTTEADAQTLSIYDNYTAVWKANYPWTDKTNYRRNYQWYEIEAEMYLKKGDKINIVRPKSNYGALCLGELIVEIDQNNASTTREMGTEPDGTDYDVWGLNGEVPISFWWAPPALETDKAKYFDPMIDCGFNLIQTPAYANMSRMTNVLDWCQDAGVKLLGFSLTGWTTDAATNEAYMDYLAPYASHPAYAGEYTGLDEPGLAQFPAMAACTDAFNRRFPTKASTVNLFPSYANNYQLNWGNGVDKTQITTFPIGTDYYQYVSRFADQVNVKCMMVDHYPLQSANSSRANRGNVKSKWFFDLDVLRKVSLQHRKPYFMITHGRPQWQAGYNGTDVEKPWSHVYDEERWLVWTQLALGSKGVSYFCYWSPGENAVSGGPHIITVDGEKTPMFDVVKTINQEIKPIGRILMKCHADGAISTKTSGNYVLHSPLKNYGPVTKIVKGNAEDVIAGCFRDATTGQYKILVTHLTPATTDGEAATPSIAAVYVDRNMSTRVKLHTVTLNALDKDSAPATTVVKEEDVPENGVLMLDIHDGTAVLVEFE